MSADPKVDVITEVVEESGATDVEVVSVATSTMVVVGVEVLVHDATTSAKTATTVPRFLTAAS